MSDIRTAQGAEPERRECRTGVETGAANDTPQARRAETRRFLHLLDPDANGFAFRTFDDNSDRAQKNLARKLNGTFTEHRAELEMLNMRGAGVFVGVNADAHALRIGSAATKLRLSQQSRYEARTAATAGKQRGGSAAATMENYRNAS